MSSNPTTRRESRSLSNAHDVTTVLLVSLLLCVVCMLSVLRFVFVSDRNKLKSGFEHSYCENTFVFDFNRCDKRISAFDSSI